MRDPRGRRAREVAPGDTVLVVGAGTVGILTLIALKLFAQPGHVIVAAKHQKQRAAAKLAGRRRDRPARTRREGRAPAHERRQAHARARPGLPARRRRRRARVHRLEERARPGAAHHEGRRPLWSCGHPRRRRRPDPAVVPRARARRGLHRDRPTTSPRRSRRPANLPDLEQLVGATYPLDQLARRDRPRDVRRLARHVQGGVPRRRTEETDTPMPQTRIRARGGRADTAAARPRGRGLPDAALPARDEGRSTRPTRCRASTTSTRTSGTRC